MPWDRIVLTEEQAADFLKMERSTLRGKAAGGQIPRYGAKGSYRYYVYDLLDWQLRAG